MHPSIVFAIFGVVSGVVATLLIMFIPEDWGVTLFDWLQLIPWSLAPGLVFGVTVGFALHHRGLLVAWRYPAYAAASTLSYLAAFTLSVQVLADALDSMLVTGLVAGLFGSALLTGFSALVMPCFRQVKPCLFMLLAGCLLGGLLQVVETFDHVLSWMFFYAAWQAGYAAALATALPRRST